MTGSTARTRIRSIARLLAVVLAAFPVLLSLDTEGVTGLGSAASAVLFHSVLAIPLIVAAILGWIRPRFGAVAFLLLGVAYGAFVADRAGFEMATWLAGPLLLAGLLFWLTRDLEAADPPSSH